MTEVLRAAIATSSPPTFQHRYTLRLHAAEKTSSAFRAVQSILHHCRSLLRQKLLSIS